MSRVIMQCIGIDWKVLKPNGYASYCVESPLAIFVLHLAVLVADNLERAV